MLERTPAASTTSLAGIALPFDRWTTWRELPVPEPGRIISTLVPVWTATPCSRHQRVSMPPAVSSIMRATMRGASSTTVRLQPRMCSASSTMQPMKPAPTSTTSEPRSAYFRISRASDSVQQVWTPSELAPSMRGMIGEAPVASSSLS